MYPEDPRDPDDQQPPFEGASNEPSVVERCAQICDAFSRDARAKMRPNDHPSSGDISDAMCEREAVIYERAARAIRSITFSLGNSYQKKQEAVAKILCRMNGGNPDAIAADLPEKWHGELWTAFIGDADKIIAAIQCCVYYRDQENGIN